MHGIVRGGSKALIWFQEEYRDGNTPNCSRKHFVNQERLLNPTRKAISVTLPDSFFNNCASWINLTFKKIRPRFAG